jgi:hypothetical protein
MRALSPLFAVTILMLVPAVAQADGSFIGPLRMISQIASTVPGNGDQNPYGTSVVPRSVGKLVAGDVMVSNFNNAGSPPTGNLQGRGTTLVEISPNGKLTLFAQIDPNHLPGACPGGVGLTTALSVLISGFVVVGSLPTSDGTAATAKAGCLLVLNSYGKVVETISGGPINGPWDMASQDFGGQAYLFVTNVLNGTVAANGNTVTGGTVVRITLGIDFISPIPHVLEETIIGSGFPERTDPTALVVGPTGVGVGVNGTLYIADTVNNRIAGISNAQSRFNSAGTGFTLSKGGALNGPLGLTIVPNGNVLTVNGGDGKMVETDFIFGQQVANKVVDVSTPGGAAGDLFGLAISQFDNGVYFVNDGNNALYLLH